MARCIRLALLVSTLAVSAAAQPMSPQAFEALSEGRTLHFTLDGAPFGAEQYFSGRRSVWRFVDGTCETGVWWGEGGRICFRYGDDAPAQCWRFRKAAGGLAASLVDSGRETGFVLHLSHVDRTPLPCPGPKVGI